jgi:hypothetical protein
MVLANDNANALRDLFSGMDAGEEADAVCAMNETATFLRQHDLSFRQIAQQIETRGLLLPSKIGAAIQLMDSTTLSEAESALAGARRLMRSCGLTFARIIGALLHEPTEDEEDEEDEEFEQLKCAFQIEVERSREMAGELQFLRARADMSGFPVRTPFRNFVLVTTFLFGVLLAASIASTIIDLLWPAHATATLRDAAKPQRDDGNASPAPRRVSMCWRDRSIRGPCF